MEQWLDDSLVKVGGIDRQHELGQCRAAIGGGGKGIGEGFWLKFREYSE